MSKLIYIHKSNVASHLGSLEEKGFIRRETDPSDKRNMLVYPTEKAYAVLDEIKRVNAEWDRIMLEGFSEEEREEVERLSALLAERAKKIIEKEEKTEDKR